MTDFIAILCNGPSRVHYDPNKEYAYRIGCNIPWTDVDCTIIMDEDVCTYWSRNLSAIKCPVYFSDSSWRWSQNLPKFEEYIEKNNLFAGIVDVPTVPKHSTGHIAVLKAIELGYKKFDIYGLDSWFEETVESYTKQFVDNNPGNNVMQWREAWRNIINSNDRLKFNFIREL
jgi:hypothetical protein